MTIAISASPSQSKYYLDLLAHLASTDADRRRDGVLSIVERARQTRSLVLRNRYWSDAVLLLNGQWRRNVDSVPLERSAVLQRSKLLDGVDAPDSLRDLTVDVLREAWDSFPAFQRSDEGQRSFLDERENWLGEFQDWFERYLPYITLGLPSSLEQADLALADRIDWMVNKAFPDAGPSDGMRASFVDAAWTYARQNWTTASEQVQEAPESVSAD